MAPSGLLREGHTASEAPAPSPSKSLLEPFAPYGTAVAAPPKAGGAPFDPFDILGPDGTKDRVAEEEATPRPNLTNPRPQTRVSRTRPRSTCSTTASCPRVCRKA